MNVCLPIGPSEYYRYSILPALGLTGILWCKIIPGAFKANTFKQFIADLLECMAPYPAPNSVIVMDNARIHKDPEMVEMIKAQ